MMTVIIFSYDGSTIRAGANPDVTFVCVTLFEAALFVLKRRHSQRVTFASWKLTMNRSSSQDISYVKTKQQHVVSSHVKYFLMQL